MSLFVFLISLLIVAQHVSGNHVPIIRSWRLRDVKSSCWYVPWLQGGCQARLAGSASMDALPTNRTWLPSCSHGTYQHKTITSRSRHLLMMGTWLPESCWETIRREIKYTILTSSWFFLSTLIRNFASSSISIKASWLEDSCWLEVSIRKVLRPATSTQVFLSFPLSISKWWDGSQHSKLPLHASHVALQT